MRLGLSFGGADPGGLSKERLLEDARCAESAGFDGLWFFDAIGRGMILPDPLQAAVLAANATRRIEVGTCVMQVPLRRPAELAHRLLTTHLLCEGRFVFGAGAGSTRTDFELVGADFDARLPGLETGLATMRTLWRGERVGDAGLDPWPSTIGGPPVLIGSWSGRYWIPKAAREFDGWIASGAKTSFDALASGIEIFRAAGGGRAVVTNIAFDLDAPTERVPDDAPFHLRCQPDEARRRMRRLAGLGFDDAIFVPPDRDRGRLDALRGLVD